MVANLTSNKLAFQLAIVRLLLHRFQLSHPIPSLHPTVLNAPLIHRPVELGLGFFPCSVILLRPHDLLGTVVHEFDPPPVRDLDHINRGVSLRNGWAVRWCLAQLGHHASQPVSGTPTRGVVGGWISTKEYPTSKSYSTPSAVQSVCSDAPSPTVLRRNMRQQSDASFGLLLHA